LIVALLIVLVAGVAAPVQGAETLDQVITLAQAVDAEPVTDMRVEEVVEQAQRYQLWIFLISTVLVIALLFAGGLLQPGGFAKAGARDLSPMPAPVWLFAAFVVLLAMLSAAAIFRSTGWLDRSPYDADQQAIIVTLTGYLLGIVAGLGMLFILKRSAPDAGMSMGGLDIPVGFGCFLLAYPLIGLAGMAAVALYTQVNSGQGPPQISHPVLEQIVNDPKNAWSWALIAGAVFGAPIVEELIYRVFLQSALIKITKSPWVAIIATSIGFALMHRVGDHPVPWHALLPILMVGITCGVGYERTKRVGVPITMHVCFNALNVLLALLIGSGGVETAV